MISVVVITYNQERTIGRTLDSILMQQCHLPVEIVIGEDCSTDGTRDICQHYQKLFPQKIHLICNEHNKGIVDNYFDCLIACRGKYIADCAGDDFWIDEKKLEKEVTLMEQHPNITLVHTAWQYYNEKTHKTRIPDIKLHRKRINHGQDMLNDIISYTDNFIIHLCSSLYRKDVFLTAYEKDRNLFRNKDFGCEDMQIVFIMAQAGDIAFLPEVTLNYSYGNSSASNLLSHEKDFQFTKRILNVVYYISKQYHIEGPDIDDSFSRRLYSLLMHAFRAHSPELRKEAVNYAKERGIRLHARHKIVIGITSNELLWKAALILRRIIIATKKAQS